MADETKIYKDAARLLKNEKFAVLATVKNNVPHASIISFTVSENGKQLLFVTPRKTRKFTNICANKNVSLVIDSRPKTSAKIKQSSALTIFGTASEVKGPNKERLVNLFSKTHPALLTYALKSDFALIAIKVKKYVFVNNIQKVFVVAPGMLKIS
ncbi:MAG: pyridoxamine 5'-phosphate oxidase family protein [Fibrobacteres bacterium]|nr:pyridoxamine 5'-phosphate oxidase family protein [Fibrobacterota bacterium]